VLTHTRYFSPSHSLSLSHSLSRPTQRHCKVHAAVISTLILENLYRVGVREYRARCTWSEDAMRRIVRFKRLSALMVLHAREYPLLPTHPLLQMCFLLRACRVALSRSLSPSLARSCSLLPFLSLSLAHFVVIFVCQEKCRWIFRVLFFILCV